jgi:hypothetical protein
MERLTFEVEIAGKTTTKAFVGRWLMEPGEEYRSEHEADDRMSGTQVAAGTTFAVAETAKERSSSSPTLEEGNPSRSLTTSAQPGKPAFLLMS